MVELGGLHIVGTERHESRRIDNQLRGRAGRQGDPGSSRFYVSLEDDVMRRFGGDRIKGVMEWAGMGEDTPIENRVVNKALETSQSKVEGFHFEIRKHLVEYDDVANMHRDVIYSERRKILEGADLKANIQDMVSKELSSLAAERLADENSDNWDVDTLFAELNAILPAPPDLSSGSMSNMHPEEIRGRLLESADVMYQSRENQIGLEEMRTLERLVMLRTIDSHWVQHLTAMENLRQGIGLHAFGQRDPLVMFKHEGHRMFQELLGRIQHDIVHTIFRVGLATETGPRRTQMPMPQPQPQAGTAANGKVGRNRPCPCGSGKKYKRCHGVAA